LKIKILALGLICLFLVYCGTISTGPKKMFVTDISTGEVIVPVKYVGGLEALPKKKKGKLYVTNSYTKFVSKTGITHLEMPTNSIQGVYIVDEVKLQFLFPYFFKGKSELIEIEFRDEEKNLIINPIFQIKIGTGQTLKIIIQLKAGLVK
jgi:hypothetical protein